MKKVYQVDVNMFGTVYVKAKSAEDAAAIVDKEWHHTSIELSKDEMAEDGKSFLSASISIESRDSRPLEEVCDQEDFTWPDGEDDDDDEEEA